MPFQPRDPDHQPLMPERPGEPDARLRQKNGATGYSAGGLHVEEGAVGIAGAADEDDPDTDWPDDRR